MQSFCPQVHKPSRAADFAGLLFAAVIPSPAQTILTFDAPCTGASFTQGTASGRLNTAGDITGWYLDSCSVFHRYLRTP